MIKKYLLFLLLLYPLSLYAQLNPQSFILQNDHKTYKISADNPIGNGISDIIMVGDTVWVGTGNGVSLTTDQGLSWTNFGGSSGFGNDGVSAMGYQNGVLWAATAYTQELNGGKVDVGSGLKYTSDLGRTWNSIPQPVDNAGDTIVDYGINHLRALAVTVPQQNVIYDIAFTPNTMWIATFAGGIRKSTDNGEKWQRVVLPPDYLDEVNPTDTLDFCLSPVAGNFCNESNLNLEGFSIIAVDDTTLYAGTAGGINKSTDGGVSWKKFTHTNQDDPISGNFVVALGYNSDSNTVWAATWKAEGQTEYDAVSSSTDGGATWQISLQNEKVHNFGFKGDNTIAPSDNGAFRTSDNGISWIIPPQIIDKDTYLPLNTNVFYSAAANGSTIWLGSADGLAKLQESPFRFWEGSWKVYFASQKLTSKDETYAFPNPFSPNLEMCKIKYSTAGGSSKVTIRIFDFGMNYVRTLIQNADRGDPIHNVDNSGTDLNGVIDYWDGRDDNGNIVPNGVYFYRIEVGSNDPVFGKIMVLK